MSLPNCPTCGCGKYRMGPNGGMAYNVQCENGHCWWVGFSSLAEWEPIENRVFGKAPGCSSKEEK